MKTVVVLGFYITFTALVVGFSIYFRRVRGVRFTGSFDISSIPRNLIWLPIAATISLLFIVISSAVFSFNPILPDWAVPIHFLMSSMIESIGMTLTVLGLVLVGTSQFQLGASYRVMMPQEDTELITRGVYSICRNPLYVGAYLGFVGIFLLMPNLMLLFAMAIAVTNNHFRILEEEKYLLQAFGDNYRIYCTEVGRYGPKLNRLFANRSAE